MSIQLKIFAIITLAAGLAFTACDGGGDGGGGDSVIDTAAIAGVTPPAYGETPVTEITENDQYTGTVSWSGSPATFAGETTYTATITLTAKTGFTLTDVPEDFFTVAGATPVSNTADTGVVTAEFPATEAAPPAVIDIAAINGVTVPVVGETPVTEITETDQYTGTVSWSGSPVTFAWATTYTAIITLTAKPGFTLTNVAEDFFTVAGATTVSNTSDTGVVTAEFPATEAEPPAVIDIAAINGITAPVIGETPVTEIIETDQYTGIVSWDGNWTGSQTFAGSKAYTTTITLTAKTGFTLTGVTTNFFTVAGVTTVTNPADSGVITAVFPVTDMLSIGDDALGGKVAYILEDGDPGFIAGEQRGLIVATEDQGGGNGIIWSVEAYRFTAVPGGTETELGTGSANTDNIIAQNDPTSTGLTTYAAGLARDYNGGGYSDWYLPSGDELIKLYSNKDEINNLTPFVIYWSSSECYDNSAYGLSVYSGSQLNFGKENEDPKVRAVRSF